MKRNQRIILFTQLTVFCVSCSGASEERVSEIDSFVEQASTERLEERDRMIEYSLTESAIDSQAMAQVAEFLDNSADMSVYEKYDQSLDEYGNWCDKLWGRCCTEADMRFTEKLNYEIKTTHDYEAYPFKNCLDEYYNTAYVFEAKDSIELTVRLEGEESDGLLFDKTPFEMMTKTDRIHDRFTISIINGYAKSEKTFKENARVKTVELWLNGVHKCNASLLDTPEIQVIRGTFAFYKTDKVKIVPTEYYPGSRYEDVCISAIQRNLGYSANAELDEKYHN